jgi:hypothetical protein
MSSYKQYYRLIFITVWSLSSCLEQKMLFDPKHDINYDFLKKVPGFGSAPYIKYPVTTKPPVRIDIYVCSFSEKIIEKNDLFQYTELNDSSRIPSVPYMTIIGSSQKLYMLHYQFTYTVTIKKSGQKIEEPTDAVIFFSIKQNASGNVLAVKPCYFGIVNGEDSLIDFTTELAFKKNKTQFYLGPLKKIQNNFSLLFIPAYFSAGPGGGSRFNVEKIVTLDKNKVGGGKPLIFNIKKIFRDQNALQFHYNNTLYITPP